MNRGCTVREFAALAGVSVKALHHYDRLGLLRPRRTSAGYRVYAAADLTRLREILALKFLGLPLRRIGELLAPGAPPLHLALRRQRQVLETHRQRLDRAIAALAAAESGLEASPTRASQVLQTLIAVIGMADDIDAMRKYYDDTVWASWRHHYEDWPSPEWRAFYRDVNAALDATPPLSTTSAEAQALGDRCLALDRAETTVAAVRTGLRKAWMDRQHWPATLQARAEAHRIDRAMAFMNEVLWERWEGERLAREAHGGGAPPRVSDARRALYRECADSLPIDPASEAARGLVTRWHTILDAETGGDAAIAEEMKASFRRRTQWPPGLRRYMAACYGLDVETWQRVADFLEVAADRWAA